MGFAFIEFLVVLLTNGMGERIHCYESLQVITRITDSVLYIVAGSNLIFLKLYVVFP